MTDAAQRREGLVFLVAFIACVPTANWMVSNVGTVCVPDGPCLLPVGFGLTAPSGVLLVGLALVLRDLVQRRLGLWAAVLAILVGSVLSASVAPASLVVASAAAFLLSETVDLAVFTPLQRKGLVLAAAASSAVGLVADSVVFLYLAFGSLDYMTGQILGKVWMVAAALPLIHFLRRRELMRNCSVS